MPNQDENYIEEDHRGSPSAKFLEANSKVPICSFLYFLIVLKIVTS